jgi:thiamine kinase-like enzyme
MLAIRKKGWFNNPYHISGTAYSYYSNRADEYEVVNYIRRTGRTINGDASSGDSNHLAESFLWTTEYWQKADELFAKHGQKFLEMQHSIRRKKHLEYAAEMKRAQEEAKRAERERRNREAYQAWRRYEQWRREQPDWDPHERDRE